MQTIPLFNGIDHAHLYVPNRTDAAHWYENTLGFSPVASLLSWANDPQGPLVLEDASGTIHLALFQTDEPRPSSHLAFSSTAIEFIAWKTYLERYDILLRCTDHTLSWSLYFNDPYENMHEITTYDYASVSQALLQHKQPNG